MAKSALTNTEVAKQVFLYPGLYALGGALIGLAEKLTSDAYDAESAFVANERIKEYALLGLGVGLFNSGKSVMVSGKNEVMDAAFIEDALKSRFPQ